MSLKSFREIKERLLKTESKRSIAVVAAEDDHTLHSVIVAWRDGMITPVLLGEKRKIEACLNIEGIDPVNFEIMDLKEPVECARRAVDLVNSSRVQGIMKGKIETGELMKVILDKKNALRTGDLISLVAFMEIPTYHKLMAITDVGLNMYPSFEQKKSLIKNAVNIFHMLGIPCPNVAVMAAVEQVNLKMPETVDAGMLKEWYQGKGISGCVVEGPISYDLAISREAAETKGFASPVAGDVDVMIVPDIVSGNLLAKSLIYSGCAKTAGVVLGARVPLIITSRSATPEDKYMSIAMAALAGSSLQ